jgi:hypothetical protein
MSSELLAIIENNQALFSWLFVPLLFVVTLFSCTLRLIIHRYLRFDKLYYRQIDQGSKMFINQENMGDDNLEFAMTLKEISRAAYMQFQLEHDLTKGIDKWFNYTGRLGIMKTELAQQCDQIGAKDAINATLISDMVEGIISTPISLGARVKLPASHWLTRASNILPTLLVVCGAIGTLMAIASIFPHVNLLTTNVGEQGGDTMQLLSSHLGWALNFIWASALFAIPVAVFNNMFNLENQLGELEQSLETGLTNMARSVESFNANLEKGEQKKEEKEVQEKFEQQMLKDMQMIKDQLSKIASRPMVAASSGFAGSRHAGGNAPALKLVGEAKPKERQNYRDLRAKNKQKKVSF